MIEMNRRAALQIGAGLLGLNLPGYLRAARAPGNSGPNFSCIFLFLAGGASQYETFDPKPQAPAEIRGLWGAIPTNVPGTSICEKLPLLAQRMDKVAVIRSWQGKDGGHDTGTQHVASGFLPTRAGQYFPNFGCLISALYGSHVPGMPAHLGGRHRDIGRPVHQRGHQRADPARGRRASQRGWQCACHWGR